MATWRRPTPKTEGELVAHLSTNARWAATRWAGRPESSAIITPSSTVCEESPPGRPAGIEASNTPVTPEPSRTASNAERRCWRLRLVAPRKTTASSSLGPSSGDDVAEALGTADPRRRHESGKPDLAGASEASSIAAARSRGVPGAARQRGRDERGGHVVT